MSSVSLARGMRDFLPETLARRKYIMQEITRVFQTYGYMPIETPSMENLEILTGKYGEEGDRLIFKILRSGDFLKGVSDSVYAEKDIAKMGNIVADKALRYDLTVPFARFVSMHRNELQFPFKRYQIQPVWRADRPQKGRFREFYQCDADVVGSDSLWQEVELMRIYAGVFKKLDLGINIRISNRKILAGLTRKAGVADKMIAFCTILDKLDKIGAEKVQEEWAKMGVSDEDATHILQLFSTKNPEECIRDVAAFLEGDEEGLSGIEEVRFVLDQFNALDQSGVLHFDPALARGLDYYTGCIFEVEAKDVSVGSIGGGGRYADLTSIFGFKNMPGVGISFGLDRIYLALEEKNLFPNELGVFPEVLVANFGDKAANHAFAYAEKLRIQGKRTEFYPDAAKLKKQLDYANQRNIPFVILIGESECESKTLVLKDMRSGNQEVYGWDDDIF